MTLKSILISLVVIVFSGSYSLGFCQTNPAQPSDRVKLVAFCTLHATSLELAYLALLAGRTDNAEVQIKEAYRYFPRLEMVTVEQLSTDIAAKAPKIPADVTVMGSKKFSRCLSNAGFPMETEHSAACYIFNRFVQGFYKTNGVGKAPNSAQDSEPQSALSLGQIEKPSAANPSPALLQLQETVRCLGLPDRVLP